MKRASIVAALLFSVVSGVIAEAQSEGQRAAAEAERAVRQQDQERIHAQIAADTIALRRIYADDFLGIGPTGVVRNKSDVVADFTSHALTYQSITTSDVLVRVYGNTAVAPVQRPCKRCCALPSEPCVETNLGEPVGAPASAAAICASVAPDRIRNLNASQSRCIFGGASVVGCFSAHTGTR
jgi:hypothetical protein